MIAQEPVATLCDSRAVFTSPKPRVTDGTRITIMNSSIDVNEEMLKSVLNLVCNTALSGESSNAYANIAVLWVANKIHATTCRQATANQVEGPTIACIPLTIMAKATV